MTFVANETSLEGGKPVELYRFSFGIDEFLFTSAQTDFVVGVPNPIAGTYQATPISRTRIKQESNEQTINGIQVIVPADNPVAVQYLPNVPDQIAEFTLHQIHRDDVDDETRQVFRGSVQSVNFLKNGREAAMQISPLTKVRNRVIPRHTYQNGCNHHLYDSRCKLLESTFEVFFTITAVSGSVITVPGAGAHTVGAASGDVFLSGRVQIDTATRLVIGQSGDDLTLLLPFNTDPLGETVRCLPGCRLRYTIDCEDKFSNRINFGGSPFVPEKNPFSTGID